jgi:hypothetical protein
LRAGIRGIKYRERKNNSLAVWKKIANRFVFTTRCITKTAANSKRNAKDMMEEMTPISASDNPIEVRRRDRKESQTNRATKYSKVHSMI